MADARAEVARLEEVLADAVVRRDVPVLERLLAPEFTLTSAETGVLPRAAWLDAALGYVVESYRFERLDVLLLGEVALVSARYAQQAVWEGTPLSYAFLLTDVWALREAGWQLVARHSSPLA